MEPLEAANEGGDVAEPQADRDVRDRNGRRAQPHRSGFNALVSDVLRGRGIDRRERRIDRPDGDTKPRRSIETSRRGSDRFSRTAR